MNIRRREVFPEVVVSAKSIVPSGVTRPSTVRDTPVSFRLLSLFRVYASYGGGLLSELGLHPGKELILMQLYDRDGQTQAKLQQALGTDHSTISRTIKRMEDGALVVRRTSGHDRRAKLVALTPRGAALRAPLQKMWTELEQLAVSTIPSSGLKAFMKTVDKLEQTYAAARDEGRNAGRRKS
jgi:DNA-binding MarR family transcriptional regulator